MTESSIHPTSQQGLSTMALPHQVYQGENNSRNFLQGSNYQSNAREINSNSLTLVGDNDTRNANLIDQDNDLALEENDHALPVIFTFKNFQLLTYLPLSFICYLKGEKAAPKQPPHFQ